MTTRLLNSKILLLILLLSVICINADRIQLKMDLNWKFLLFNASNLPTCQTNAFPINMNGVQCIGLGQADATSADECASVCCNDFTCQTWQWCPKGAAGCSPAGSCWVGKMSGCHNNADWQGGGRNSTPPNNNTKCETPYCMPDYNDNSWRDVNVPHDFVIEGTFSSGGDQSHGYLPKGIGWYRKHFVVPQSYKGKSIWIYFDGVYRDSSVYLNGVLLGNHPSGYTGFYYFIDSILNYGGADNVLAVRANALQNEGWWYEGGGIYRHVWMSVTDNLHIDQWGVYAPSTVTGGISWNPTPKAATAQVSVMVTVVNDYAQSKSFSVDTVLLDKNGNTVGQALTMSNLNGNSNKVVSQSMNLNNIDLWDVGSPTLYNLVTSISVAGTIVDHVNTNIGVRNIVFDKDQGLLLNGKTLKVKGFCNHQDFAGLGTALPDRINEFRVTKLQEMGANGWRMSHNPPNSELLDITDKLGMVVWDENRNFGSDPQYYADVAVLPLRDRNHPSIIMWSLCNEGGCMEGANDTNALNIATTMKSIIRSYDNTRVISAAWNAGLDDLLYGWGPKVLDVQGVNYNYGEIDPYHAKYPTKPMISSETASCTGARGIYVSNDTAAHKSILSANGCAIDWWTADATRNFVAGGFAWTGFDYKGEPTPYSWPEVNSNFGVIDIAGFPKDTFWYYQSWWISTPVLHIFPPWNPPTKSSGLNVASCSSNPDQKFTFTGANNKPGQIIDGDGLCVDATCQDVATGCVPLALTQCTNSNNQQFVHADDGSFKNVANGGCMDLWDSGQGPQVGVYSCDGGANQHWQFSGNQIKSADTGNRCLSISAPTQVWAYSNADTVELFINGASQGKQTVTYLGNVIWDVSYVPGTVEVRGYDKSGKVIATQSLSNTGAPASIKLEVEVGQNGIFSDQQDAALIKGSILDSNGNLVPTASNFITFTTSGPGSVVGVGNGDPSCHEPDRASSRSAFMGLVRAVVQATDQSGSIVVTASSPGLASAKVTVTSKAPQNPIPTI